MKTGTTVRLIQPEIVGVVKGRHINPQSDELELLVEWTDAAGETHQRWLAAAQIEEVQ